MSLLATSIDAFGAVRPTASPSITGASHPGGRQPEGRPMDVIRGEAEDYA
jgi:hypothetical protein